MATTQITIAAFQTACAECADAIAAKTFDTAMSWYARAEAINAGFDLDASAQDTRSRRRETLQGLKAAIEAAEAAAARGSAHSRFIKTQTRHTP